jgi:hypothetical protein
LSKEEFGAETSQTGFPIKITTVELNLPEIQYLSSFSKKVRSGQRKRTKWNL